MWPCRVTGDIVAWKFRYRNPPAELVKIFFEKLGDKCKSIDSRGYAVTDGRPIEAEFTIVIPNQQMYERMELVLHTFTEDCRYVVVPLDASLP